MPQLPEELAEFDSPSVMRGSNFTPDPRDAELSHKKSVSMMLVKENSNDSLRIYKAPSAVFWEKHTPCVNFAALSNRKQNEHSLNENRFSIMPKASGDIGNLRQ